MARRTGRGDLGIILRTLVDILDHQADRRAGRAPLEHARENTNLIGLLPLSGEARAAGPALVEPGLDVAFRQRQAGRAAVDHRAERRPVALAPSREAED